MPTKPWVYIASPYTKGDQAINVRFQMRMWELLLDLGVVPIAPLWSHFQHLHAPRPYQDWIDYDNEIIPRCDACLRLDAEDFKVGYRQSESTGADAEVKLFESLGKPVFCSLDELVHWHATSMSKTLTKKLPAEVPYRLIGLAGNIGSGKSAAAGMIPEAHHLQWADPIYAGLSAMLGVPELVLRDRVAKEKPLAVAGIEIVPRHGARTLGTEWGRELIHPDLWVRLMMQRIDQLHRMTGHGAFAICGTRFSNEVAAIRERDGEVWWIERNGTTSGRHVSDRVLTANDCDRIIMNNGPLDALRANIEAAWADFTRSSAVPHTAADHGP